MRTSYVLAAIVAATLVVAPAEVSFANDAHHPGQGTGGSKPAKKVVKKKKVSPQGMHMGTPMASAHGQKDDAMQCPMMSARTASMQMNSPRMQWHHSMMMWHHKMLHSSMHKGS